MRPRGESISTPRTAYVGQVGRQNPQCTQRAMRSCAGASAFGYGSAVWDPRGAARVSTASANSGPSGFEHACGVEGVFDPAHDRLAARTIRPRGKARGEVVSAPLDPATAADNPGGREQRLDVADDGVVLA